jgi:hypothetical protein
MSLAHDGGGRRGDGELDEEEDLAGESIDRGSGMEAARCGEVCAEMRVELVEAAPQVPGVKVRWTIGYLDADLNEDV